MTSRATIFFNFARYYSQEMKRRIKWKDKEGNLEGVKYGHVTYYPRHPNHVDPPFEPSKLLFVTRVKPFYGNPWWDKNILKHLGFSDRKHCNSPLILKNTPEICALLWRVKHLVKIVPIKLPDELPTADDPNDTYLHENGTLYVVPKVDPAREEATVKFVNDPKKLNRDIIKKKLLRKWVEGGDMN